MTKNNYWHSKCAITQIKLTKSRHVQLQLSNVKEYNEKSAEADKNMVENANWKRGT